MTHTYILLELCKLLQFDMNIYIPPPLCSIIICYYNFVTGYQIRQRLSAMYSEKFIILMYFFRKSISQCKKTQTLRLPSGRTKTTNNNSPRHCLFHAGGQLKNLRRRYLHHDEFHMTCQPYLVG